MMFVQFRQSLNPRMDSFRMLVHLNLWPFVHLKFVSQGRSDRLVACNDGSYFDTSYGAG